MNTTDVVIATDRDKLVVVAHLRCATERTLLGAVLHLDRTARGLPPLLLAELARAEHDEAISTATRAGRPTTGDRYNEISAVPMDGDGWPTDASVRLDCSRTQKIHPVTVAELCDAGRRGFRRIHQDRRRPGHAARPMVVQLDHQVSRWSPTGRDSRTDFPH